MKRFVSKAISLFLCIVMIFGAAPLNGFVDVHPGTFLSNCVDKVSEIIDGISFSKIKVGAADTDEPYTVTLIWGADPSDLDSHLEGTMPDGSSFHCYYRNMDVYYGSNHAINLDVDDTSSYGPEVVTIYPCMLDADFSYYVYNYSQSGTMTHSQAEVELKKGNKVIWQGKVPTNNNPGLFWTIFKVKNGCIYIVNEIGTSVSTSFGTQIATLDFKAININATSDDIVIIPRGRNTEHGVYKLIDNVFRDGNNNIDDIYDVTLSDGTNTWVNSLSNQTFTIPGTALTETYTLSCPSYRNYVIPGEVLSSWKTTSTSVSKKSTPSNSYSAYMNMDSRDGKPYISTIFGRKSGDNAYKELRTEQLSLKKDTEYDVIITALNLDGEAVQNAKFNSRNVKTQYHIIQDDLHDVISENGRFSSVELGNALQPGKKTYAYVVVCDNFDESSADYLKNAVFSEIVEVKLEIEADSGWGKVSSFCNGSTFDILGKDFLKFKIPDNVTLLGGAEIGFDAFKFPAGFEFSDNRLRISLGCNIFESENSTTGGWNYNDSGSKYPWSTSDSDHNWFGDWKDMCDKTISDACKDNVDKKHDKYNTYKQQKDQYLSRHGKASRLSKETKTSFDLEALGYIDLELVNGELVVREALISIEGKFTFKYTLQAVVWIIPAYCYVEAGGSLGGTAHGSRVVADSDIPFNWEFTIKLEPQVKLGAGVGVEGFASLGLYTKATLPVIFNFTTKHLTIDLTGEIGAEGRLIILHFEKKLLDGTINICDKYWGPSTNTKKVRKLNSVTGQMEEYLITANVQDRDYLSSTSGWLGTGQVRKLRKAAALNRGGLNISNLQTSVYDDAQPRIVSFDDKMLMTWIEDDSSRDEYNRTRLMYSVYDGSSWNEPRAVYDDGCLDNEPYIVSDGTDVYFVWSKINRELTESDWTLDNINQVVSSLEIYSAKYDSETDSICNVRRLTNNSLYDYSHSIALINGTPKVYWVSCNDGRIDSGSDNTLYCASFDGTVTEVEDGLNYVLHTAAAYVDGAEHISYSMDSDGDTETTGDINVYTYCNGNVTEFEKEYDIMPYTVPIYGVLDGENKLFVSDLTDIYYEEDGEIISVLNGNAPISGNINYVHNDDSSVFFWTQNEEKGNAIYAVSYENGEWSSPIKLSDTETFLGSLSATIYNNQIKGVCISTELEPDDDEENPGFVQGQTNLCSFTLSEIEDLSLENIIIDEKDIVPGEESEFTVFLRNNGSKTVENVTFTISDGEGYNETVDVEANVKSGEYVPVPLVYAVPVDFNTRTLSVSVSSDEISESDTENNTTSLIVGVANITITEPKVNVIGSDYVLSTMITNESSVTAQDVTITAFINDSDGEEHSHINVGTLGPRESKAVEYKIGYEDIEFDENDVAKIYLNTAGDEYFGYVTCAAVTKSNNICELELLSKTIDGKYLRVVGVSCNNSDHYARKYAIVRAYHNDTLVGIDAFCADIYAGEALSFETTMCLSDEYDDVNVDIEVVDSLENVEIVIPEGVTEILDDQFIGLADLTSIVIPDSVIVIGDNAFSGCNSITEIVLPENLESLGDGAFSNCESLEKVIVSDSVESIGEGAFSNSPDVTINVFGEPGEMFDFAAENGIECRLTYGDYTDGQAVNYEIVNGNAVITGLVRTDEGTVTIPDSIGDYNVVSIAQSAFADCEEITSVEIGSNVEIIGTNAFSGCSNLENVDFPESGSVNIGSFAFSGCESLTEIDLSNAGSVGAYAFSDCSELETVILGDSAENIANMAFDGCDSLSNITIDENNENYCIVDGIMFSKDMTELVFCPPNKAGDVVIPKSVKTIKSFAFNSCSEITSVTFNEGLESIGDYAFYGCESLESITLPDSLCQIGTYSFGMCDSLTSVDLGNGIETVPSNAFNSCNEIRSLTIGESVTSINKSAFSDCSKLENLYFNAVNCSNFTTASTPFKNVSSESDSLEVVFGDKVKSVPDYLLYPNSTSSDYVSPITSVVFGNSVERIGKYSLYNCSSISEISIPDSTVKIGDYAFWNCKQVNTFDLGNAVEEIGNYAFYSCNNFNSIDIPDSTERIGDYAFAGCSNVLTITIGENVKAVGNRAFENANRVNSIFFNAVDMDDLSGKNIFYNAGSSSSDCSFITGNKVSLIPGHIFNNGSHSYIRNVTISDSVDSIGEYAFVDCSYISTLNLGNGVECIGNNAFYRCSNLTALEIPDSVLEIGEYSFYSCSRISNIEFGENLEIIGDNAFNYCTSLTSLEFPDSLSSIGEYSFANCTRLENVTYGDNLTDIGICAFSGCTNLRTIVDKDGVAQMEYDDGVMFNADRTELISCVTSKSGRYVVPNTVVTIDEKAFYQCSRLTEIVLPNSLVTIGNYAFYGCTSLTDINIPKSVKYIGNSAFYECSKITEIILPNSLKYLGNLAFYNCSSVTNLTIGTKLTRIGDNTFYNLNRITEIVIPDNVKSIGAAAFSYCSSVTDLTIGEGVEFIGNSAFYNCTSLTSIKYNAVNVADFSENYNSNYRFYNAGKNGTGIDVVFGNNVERIPAYLFYPYNNSNSYKPKICTVTFGNDVKSVGDYAFYNGTGITSVTGMDSVSVIGDYAFYNCSSLTEINIPYVRGDEGSIGQYAFYGCAGLGSVEIPESIKSIGLCAFQNCTSMTSAIIGDGVVTIGEAAFRDCTALTELTIGESVEIIGNTAFYNCTYLTSIRYNAENVPDFSENYNSNYRFYNAGKNGTGIDVVFGDNVERIPAYLFYPYNGNSSYKPNIKTVILGSNTDSIGRNAFYGCSSLTSVIVPNETVAIDGNPFSFSSSLTVYGPKSSDIENYCSLNGIKFIPFGLNIVSLPTKINYQIGEEFDSSGMIVCSVDAEGIETVDDYTVSGFDSEADGYCKITVRKGLKTTDFYVVIGNAEPLTVSYFLYEGVEEPFATYTVEVNDVVTRPNTFSRPGYTFDGWNEVIPERMPAENLSFTAKWKENRISLGEVKTVEIKSNQLTYLKFTPEVSGNYSFTSISSSDTYGYLYDSNMNQLAANDDGGSGSNFKINYYMNAGTTYIFGVRYYSSSNSGGFDVTLNCLHTFGDYIVDREPTCSEYGVMHRACSVCGYCEEEPIEKTEHQYGDYIVDSNPTCSEEGSRHHVCSECGFEETEAIPTIPHTFSHNNCMYDSEMKLFTAVCTECGESIGIQDCYEISYNETVSISSYGEFPYVVFVPEETGNYAFYSVGDDETYCILYDGLFNYICEGCGDGNNPNFKITSEFEAGKLYVFEVSNWSCLNDTFDVTIGCDHQFDDYTVDREPTCSTPGQQHRTCSACGFEQTIEIATLPHTYSEYTFNSETHSLEAECTACDNINSIEDCYSIDINDTVSVEITDGSRYVVFIPEHTGAFSLLSLSDSDTFCYLYDSSLSLLDYNDDGGDGYNFKISRLFEAGKLYVFEVCYYSKSNTGSFDVTLSCSHEFGEYIVDVEPTCTEDGSQHRVCSLCGYEETAVINGGHDFNHIEYDHYSGMLSLVCSRCNYHDENTMSAWEIRLGEIVTVSLDDEGMAYCVFIPEVSGEYQIYSVSDYDTMGILADDRLNVFDEVDDYNGDTDFRIARYFEAGKLYLVVVGVKDPFENASIEIKAECNHHIGNMVIDTAASCEEDGTGHGICDLCGEVQTVTLPATGHSNAYVVNEDEASVSVCCSNCGIVFETIDNLYFIDINAEESYEYQANQYDGASLDIVFKSDVKRDYKIVVEDADNISDLYTVNINDACAIEMSSTKTDSNTIELTISCDADKYYVIEFDVSDYNSSVRFTVNHNHTCSNLIVDAVADCTTNGYGHGICEICGEEFSTVIPASHRYMLDYNVQQKHVSLTCSVCGASNGMIDCSQMLNGVTNYYNEYAAYYFECNVSGIYKLNTTNTEGFGMIIVYPDGKMTECEYMATNREISIVRGTKFVLVAYTDSPNATIRISLEEVDKSDVINKPKVKFADSSIEAVSGNEIYLYPCITNPYSYDLVWEANKDNVTIESLYDGCYVTVNTPGTVKITAKLIDENGKVVAKDTIKVKVGVNRSRTREYGLTDNDRFVKLFEFIALLFKEMIKKCVYSIF